MDTMSELFMDPGIWSLLVRVETCGVGDRGGSWGDNFIATAPVLKLKRTSIFSVLGLDADMKNCY